MARRSHPEWGERLSDRIRAALAAGDLPAARRLALEGDGQARSLAREFALMYKGLGITIRLMLDLAGERAARAPETATAALTGLLQRFRRDMLARLEEAYGATGDLGAPASPAPSLGEELVRTRHLLGEAEALFSLEQAERAEEILGAIASRDIPKARALLDRKEQREYLPLHDRLIRVMAEVFGWVLAHFGPSELGRFHQATADGQRQGFDKWEQLSPEEFARAAAFLLKQHMGRVEVHEDAEKFTVIQRPCGSGGRLRLAGAYQGPGALPFVEARGPLTAGQARFPVYCSHCPIWNSVAPHRWYGHPQWVFEDPSRPDGSCTLHIYKAKDGAPAAYLARLGLEAARR